jgi:hypothetical protein
MSNYERVSFSPNLCYTYDKQNKPVLPTGSSLTARQPRQGHHTTPHHAASCQPAACLLGEPGRFVCTLLDREGQQPSAPRRWRTLTRKQEPMPDVIIENPVINSPFEEAKRHFRFTKDGITDEIVAARRISQYFIPIAQPKKKHPKQLAFQTEWTADRVQENKFINRVRQAVTLLQPSPRTPAGACPAHSRADAAHRKACIEHIVASRHFGVLDGLSGGAKAIHMLIDQLRADCYVADQTYQLADRQYTYPAPTALARDRLADGRRFAEADTT